MIKGFRQIAFLTLISRILGMARDMAYSHFLGAGWLMTAWTMGFKIPNLARRLFGEGAAAASFIPVYSRQLHENPENAKRLASTVVSVLFVLLSFFVIIGEIILYVCYKFTDKQGTQLGIILAALMLPYMIAICIVAILAGILNVHRHFATPAAAPVMLNIIIILSLILSGNLMKMPAEKMVFYVACGVLIAGLAQIAMQLPPLIKSGIRLYPAWDIKSEAFKKILLLMGPMILGLTVTQINTLADDLIALSFSNEQGTPLSWGSVSYLYYAQRLYQFPLGVLGISLATAIFPIMSADAGRKDYVSLVRTISRGIKSTIFIALPATAGLVMTSRLVVALIYQHGEFTADDTSIVSFTLVFYCLGLCGYFAQQVCTRAFYSTQDSKLPAITAAIAVLINVVLNLILLWPLGTAGLALSTAICSYIQVIILVSVLKRRFGQELLSGLAISAMKSIISTMVMVIIGITLLWIMRPMDDSQFGNIIKLSVIVPACSIVYLGVSIVVKNEMVSLVFRPK